MTAPSLIPAIDPNPLPAPYWVFQLLLFVTFFLHIVAMDLMVGGAVLALVARWRKGSLIHGSRLSADLARKLPVLMPAVITLGIAPLLFVQVLYGQFLYTSSIILAWPWLFVLILLAAAYYGFYFVSYKQERYPRKAGLVLLLSVVAVFCIGFMLSNNITLSQTPDRWGAKYFADPAGWNLNLSEPTLFPRYLHFMVAAVAVGGILLVLMSWARWKKDPEYARDMFHFGGIVFIYATVVEFAVGTWFLLSLPWSLGRMLLGGYPVVLIGVAFLGAAGAIATMVRALHTDNVRLAGTTVTGIMALVIFGMVVVRGILRNAYLAPYFHPDQFAVKTQWTVLPLFLALFIAGVVLWFIMLKRFGLFSPHKPAG